MSAARWTAEVLGDRIITSLLLILQSKRLMLSSVERRYEEFGLEPLRLRVEELRVEAEKAQHDYRHAVLIYSSPATADYWLVAYSRLIGSATALSRRLAAATDHLPARERYEASADIEALEEIVASWSKSMREAMVAAVA